MPLTLPASFESRLIRDGAAGVVRLVYVYEFRLAAGTLYRSSQLVGPWTHPEDSPPDVTYTRAIVSQGNMVDPFGTRVPDTSLRVSNVDGELRAQLEPLDLLTGRELVVRALMRDDAGALLADSLVLWRGHIERPNMADDKHLQFGVVRLARGGWGQVPPRFTSEWCGIRQYADGTRCPYSSSGTTSGSGSGSGGTTVVQLGTGEADVFAAELARIVSPDVILVDVGADTDLELDAADTGAHTITIGSEFSWGTGEAVRFSRCDREHQACVNRAVSYAFQGFRGLDGLEFQAWESFWDNASPATLTRPPSVPAPPVPLDNRRRVAPVVLGRRGTPGNLIERSHVVAPQGGADQAAEVYALHAGELEEVVRWFENGAPNSSGAGSFAEYADSYYANGDLRLGFYYRKGVAGVEDQETAGEYIADPTTKLRDQNRDYYSVVKDTNSRMATGTLIYPAGEEDAPGTVTWDVKGTLVQKYTALGAPDGARVFSRNPVWLAVEFFLNQDWGLGWFLSASDLNFAVIKPEADYCDTLINGPETTTTATVLGWPDGEVIVADTKDFTRGMVGEFDNGVDPPTPIEVLAILSPTRLLLDVDVSPWAGGETIRTFVPRYTCNLILDRQVSDERALAEILLTCLGYLTYDAEGRLEVRVERAAVASSAHYWDVGGPAGGMLDGYRIREGSFRWLRQDTSRAVDPVNRVFVEYMDQEGRTDEAMDSDFVHIPENHLVPMSVRAVGVDNRHQAYRLARTLMARIRSSGTPAQFEVGPIGLKHQPGDVIEITHQNPGWSGAFKRVTRVERQLLGSASEGMVRLTVEDYKAATYGDFAPPIRFTGNTNEAAIVLTADQAGGRITLRWTYTGGAVVHGFEVYRSEATWDGSSPPRTDLIHRQSRTGTGTPRRGRGGRTYDSGARPRRTMFVYTPQETEYGDTLFFVVVARGREGFAGLSNEVSVEVLGVDPTDTEREATGENLVFGGDLAPGDEGLWNGLDPTVSEVDPDTETAIEGGGYSNPTQGYTGDANYASALITGPGIPPATKKVHEYGFSVDPGAPVDALVRIRSNRVRAGAGRAIENHQRFLVSFDGGTTWDPIGISASTLPPTGASNRKWWIASALVNAERTDIKIRAETVAVYGNDAGDTIEGRVWDIDLEEVQAGAAGFLAGGQGHLRGVPSSTWIELTRPFPGESGDPGYLIPGGLTHVTQIWLKGDATPTGHVKVQLLEDGKSTRHTVMNIPKSDIGTTWEPYSAAWAPTADVNGPLRVSIRTDSGVWVHAKKLSIELGDMLRSWTPHRDQLAYKTDNRYGRLVKYDRGPWDFSAGLEFSAVRRGTIV